MKKITTLLLIILVVAMFINCSDDSGTEPGTTPVNQDAPSISFISPVAGDSVIIGDTMQITIKMKAKKDPITKVQFLIDGYLIKELVAQSNAADTLRNIIWQAPDTVGTHTFKVIAFAPGNMESSATVHNIRVTKLSSGAFPARPIFYSKSTDSAMVETGIDAVSEGDYIYLEWKPNKESDLLGYIVERKDPDSTQWIQLGTMLAKGDTTYLDNSDGLIDNNNTNKKFFYRVLAVNQSGNRSEPSFEESYRLLPKVTINEFIMEGSDSLKIVCNYEGDYNSIYFNFRFYENNRIVYVYERNTLIQDNQNTFYFDNRQFNFDTNALTVRVDAKYSIRKGSESYLKQLSRR